MAAIRAAAVFDPFAEPNDSDTTVMRPVPGGRPGRTVAPAPSGKAAMVAAPPQVAPLMVAPFPRIVSHSRSFTDPPSAAAAARSSAALAVLAPLALAGSLAVRLASLAGSKLLGPKTSEQSRGMIFWSLPARMKVWRPERVEVRVSDAEVDKERLYAGLRGRGTPLLEPLEIAPLMRVKLIADPADFSILPLGT